MNNDELDQRLRSASPPERSEAYWREFPESVERRILAEKQRAEAAVRPGFHPSLKWIWRLALPGAAVVIALLLMPGQQPKTPIHEQLSSLRAGYEQVAALFPGQLETVVFGGDEPYLQLSDLPDVPSSPPLFVRICPPSGKCVTAVSFSGQKVRVSGREFEVLANGVGEIFLLAKEGVWSPGQAPVGGENWRFETGWLERHL